MIHPDVDLNMDHPLSRFGSRLRLWSRPSVYDGRLTATMFLMLFWLAWFVALAALFPRPEHILLALAFTDVALRRIGIRTRVLCMPVWLVALVILCAASVCPS